MAAESEPVKYKVHSVVFSCTLIHAAHRYTARGTRDPENISFTYRSQNYDGDAINKCC